LIEERSEDVPLARVDSDQEHPFARLLSGASAGPDAEAEGESDEEGDEESGVG
jgi:hypothetical protein